MSFGFRTQTSSQSSRHRVGALALFSLSGLIVGLGAPIASAQNATKSASGVDSTSTGESRPSAQRADAGKRLMVKLGNDVPTEYIIKNPSWRESKAVRELYPNRPGMNLERTLFSRILVGVENETALKTAIDSVATALGSNRPGSHAFKRFLGEPGVYVVEANSVVDAINLANELTAMPGVNWAEVDYQAPVENKAITTDPSAADQWHVRNTTGPFVGNDHQIDLVYDRGIDGSGVVVGILEAFENSFYHVDENSVLNIHPDLADNLSEDLSIPTFPFAVSYSHGVSVAGLVAGVADNGLAGSGVAYGAKLASLRNGSGGLTGEAFGHELRDIDIVNNSWGPVLDSYPASSTGKYLVALGTDDYEIDIPQMGHADVPRFTLVGLDQGVRLGRQRKGRIFVFAAGNDSQFQGFARLALGNAISLPGFGIPDGLDIDNNPTWSVPEFGYLDIDSLGNSDGDGDGVPDAFRLDGTLSGSPWRWNGGMGERVEYSEMISNSRTFAIASIGMDNNRSGYSTTGCSILAGAYSQQATEAQEFSPDPGGSWGIGTFGQGLVTLEQDDGVDSDADFGVDCNAVFSTSFVDDDLEQCMFNGTSAAAPVAAGIFALMLDANPGLTLRDMQHIIQQTSTVVNFDPTNSYWPSVILGLGATDTDDGNPPTPTFWTTNEAGVRHSDEYGFGIIDADAAVEAALTWPGVGQLIILDSGDVAIEDGEIEDATFVQTAIVSPNLETNVLQPGARSTFVLNCVRQNLTVEAVELTVTVTGDGAGDLLIALQGPSGVVSPLALPRGDSNGLNGTAYNDFTFSTYKHWGELSGGQWNLIIQDYRPDAASPEGEVATAPQPSPPDPEDFGIEQVTYLGPFGLPGNVDHTQKTLVSYRLKIFGTENGLPIFEGCAPTQTQCPADLDGNGVVDLVDLQIYINWFIEANPLADLDFDGDVDFSDLFIFRALWAPGSCNSSGNPFVGGRPHPGGSNIGGGNDPVVRPI